MAEYTIDKIEYGGNTYKLQDNISGYIKLSDIPLASATANGIVPMSGTDTKPRILSARANGLVYWENFEIWDTTTQQQVGEYTQDEEGVYLGINEATTTAPGLMSKEDKIAINTIPTKTSDLTNDSGFITSYTDEKVKWTVASVPSSGTTTYYPLVNTSTATTSTLNTIAGFSLEYSAAATSRTLVLGHSTNIGVIKLYQGTSSSKYVTIEPSSDVSTSRTIQLPNKNGTVALTSDIPDVSGFITSDSDEKVKVAAGASTGTDYYPILATGAGTATRQYLNTIHFLGSSSFGTQFILGKSDGTSQGLIQLWSKTSGYYASISPANTLTAARGFTLPDKDGTFALTSDLSSYVEKSGDTMTGSLVMASGTSIHFTTNKSSEAGGWAHDKIIYRDASNTIFARIGIYGSADQLNYWYLGEEAWSSTDNIRFYNKGSSDYSGGGIIVPNNGVFGIRNASGAMRTLINVNASNQYFFGYGGYANNEGSTFFDGNTINIRSKNAVAITAPSGVTISTTLTLAGHSAAIGTITTTSGTTTLANTSSFATISDSKITLTAGTYVLTIQVNFPANATGQRGIAICQPTDNATNAWGEGSVIGPSTASGWTCRMNATRIVELTASSTTLGIAYVQSSGSSLSTPWYIRAVRIA